MPKLSRSTFDISSGVDSYKEMFEDTPSVKKDSEIVKIDPAKIRPYRNHTYEIKKDRLEELKVSIRENGQIQPVLVTELEDDPGFYEIFIGHHRWTACKELGIDVLAIIKSANENQIAILSVDSQIQNNNESDRKPSEIAKSLKLKYENEKALSKKTRLINTLEHPEADTKDEFRMSLKNLRRYYRLNNLISELLQMVDNNEKGLGLKAGSEIACIEDPIYQLIVFNVLSSPETSINEKKAIEIKKKAKHYMELEHREERERTPSEFLAFVEACLLKETTVKAKKFEYIFPPKYETLQIDETLNDEIEGLITEFLDNYFKKKEVRK